MKYLIIILTVVTLALFSGCAKFWDQVHAKGGMITSHKASYIVISQSGGKIMDVYWLFRNANGHPVFLSGDVKTIRLRSFNDPIWESYHEYHMENEVLSHREKFHPAPKEY